MGIDPQELVKTAQANGEKKLAQWLQDEVDKANREVRIDRIKVALFVIAFWSCVAALVYLLVR